MISLDTNAIIALLRADQRDLRLRYRDALASGLPIVVSSIVLFEFHYGFARGTRRHDNTVQLKHFLSGPITVLSFEPEDALVAGEVRAGLEARGTPIGPYDVLIAGQALRHAATLVTANTREFARIPGLKVADWTAP